MAAEDDGTTVSAGKAGGTLARATRLWSTGKAAQAETLCRRVLAGDPDNAEALNLLGIMAADSGRLDDAVDRFEAAVASRPEFAAARVNLARAYLQADRPEAAADALAAVMSGGQAEPETLNVLGLVRRAQGRPIEAIDAFRRAVAAGGDYVEALSNLANATLEHGDLAAAVEHFRRLLELRPNDHGARTALATALWRLGDGEPAMEHFRRVLEARPDDAAACIGLSLCLRGLVPAVHNPAIEAALLTCFASGAVRHQDLARTAAVVLKLKHGIGPVADAEAALASALDLSRDPLFRALMTQTVNIDRDLELLLNGVRRTLLLAPAPGPDRLPLISLLAVQGFNNAYVSWLDDDEAEALAALAAERPTTGKAPLDSEQQERLLRTALYAPLADRADAPALAAIAADAWSPPLAPVVERTLIEVGEEAAIAETIAAFGSIDNDVSAAVRAQYEESPYPRWLSAKRPPPIDLATRLQGLFPALEPGAVPAAPLDVLVAGCGTGLQLIHYASTGPQDRILAVDLSRRSLAYGRRMAGRYGVGGIEFLQADLLALGGLDRSFDVIVSTGVLHHMSEPERGWRVLTGLLRPGGVMNVALYGARPRAAVAAVRERIRERGLGPTAADIRAFRREVMTRDDPVSIAVRTHWEDFYDLDGCRDMFFHVHEREFALADLAGMIAAQGLDFLGFDLEDPATAQAYGREHPEDAAMTDLVCWAEFEDAHPEAFIGMYNFWCRKPTA